MTFVGTNIPSTNPFNLTLSFRSTPQPSNNFLTVYFNENDDSLVFGVWKGILSTFYSIPKRKWIEMIFLENLFESSCFCKIDELKNKSSCVNLLMIMVCWAWFALRNENNMTEGFSWHLDRLIAQIPEKQYGRRKAWRNIFQNRIFSTFLGQCSKMHNLWKMFELKAFIAVRCWYVKG